MRNNGDSHPEDLLTPGEVARMFRVDPKTVTRWAAAGKLPETLRTPGRQRRWRRADIERVIRESVTW